MSVVYVVTPGSDTAGDPCPLYARDCGSAVSGAKRKAGSHRIRRTVAQWDQGLRRCISRPVGETYIVTRRESTAADGRQSGTYGGARFIRDVRGDISIEQHTCGKGEGHAERHVLEQGGTAFF